MAAGLDPADRRRLQATFKTAQAAGDIGPGPVDRHIDHSLELARCLRRAPGRLLDLGSGGGIPGLVWALLWPEASVALLEANQRRSSRLERALVDLGLEERCGVVGGRAEEAGHDPKLRERFDVVVARAFEGGPATTAECGACFLALGGVLVVSEPPGGSEEERWPVSRMQELGLGAAEVCGGEGAAAVRIQKETATPGRYPRRIGVPRKRPLW